MSESTSSASPAPSSRWLLPGIAGAVFLLLSQPVWRWLWGEWMNNDYYSHGLLVLPVSLFLIVQRFRHDDGLAWPPAQGSNRGLMLVAPALLLYVYFLNDKAYYLAAFAVVALLIGMVWTFGGDNTVRRLAFPLGYLAFMVPLPFVERSTLPLAMFTGVCSGGLVQFLGLDVTIVGNAVTLPNADLVIGAQCSGVNSLIALLALTTLAAYILDGPLWARLLLIVLAVPLAVLGNILRVSSLLYIARYMGVDAAFTFYHDYSGPIFFVLALLLLALFARLLRCDQVRPEVI